MSTTNIQAFSGDVTVAGELTATGGVENVILGVDGTDTNRPVVFATGTTGVKQLKTDPGLTYNPSNNYLNTTANHAQDADYAGDAGNIYVADRDSNNTNAQYMIITDSHVAGQRSLYTDANASYNPSTNYLNVNSATANHALDADHAQDADAAAHAQDADAAAHAQDADYAAHAQDADYAGDAGNIYVTDRDTNNTNAQYMIITDSHTAGQRSLYTDQNAYYNPSTGYLSVNCGRANHAQDADAANRANHAQDADFATNATNITGRANHAQDADRANHAQDADNANHAGDADYANRTSILGNYVHIQSQASGSNKVTYLRMTEDDDLTYFQFRNQQSTLNREIGAQIQGYLEQYSDDRLKVDEKYLTDGLDVIKRLKPQVYNKRPDLVENMIEMGYDANSIERKEVGFIAQDIYYQIPELKHVVSVGGSVTPASNVVIGDDPTVDPDYSSWGNVAATVHYTEIIPYNTAAIQDLSKLRDSDVGRITVLESQVVDLIARVQTLESGNP